MENSSKNFACNVPIGAQIGEKFLRTTDAYLQAIFDARKDREVAKRLKLLITSAGNPSHYMEKIKNEKGTGLLHFHVSGSVRQAKNAEHLGVDGVIASGYEMGGHTHRWPDVIHTFVLLPAVLDAVKVPVVASGGICDGKTLAGALSMGAIGGQMGTRFIATKECDFHDEYKKAIVDCPEFGDMICPGAYSDLRVVKTEGALKAIEAQKAGYYSHDEMIDMVDKKLLGAERDGEVAQGEVAAGQCSMRITDIPTVEELIKGIIEDATTAIQKVSALVT
jgi:NAD(P)H-dependent flavin oxidoreductase YrpB (nitropropane dioxygenase family)